MLWLIQYKHDMAMEIPRLEELIPELTPEEIADNAEKARQMIKHVFSKESQFSLVDLFELNLGVRDYGIRGCNRPKDPPGGQRGQEGGE